MKTTFNKPAITITEQIELLRLRGMTIEDSAEAEHYLKHLNYYRLGAYWLPYEDDHASHQFKTGTSFRRVLDHYIFDRELRLLVLDAIERVEVSVRSQWAHQLGLHHHPFAHADAALARNSKWWQLNLAQLIDEVQRSKEVFVLHFQAKYSNPLPPIWAACEVMSLGLLSKLYGNLRPIKTRQLISRTYGIDHEVLESWLHHLTYVRNVCAHHSRLWNREVTVTPKVPTSTRISLHYEMISGRRDLYNTLVLLDYMLSQISPRHEWRSRLVALIRKYQIDPARMGFPSGPCRLLSD